MTQPIYPHDAIKTSDQWRAEVTSLLAAWEEEVRMLKDHISYLSNQLADARKAITDKALA